MKKFSEYINCSSKEDVVMIIPEMAHQAAEFIGVVGSDPVKVGKIEILITEESGKYKVEWQFEA